MSTTFVFEELDSATREYLLAVRDSEGVGAPGVFVPTSDALPGCGCIAGPIIIIATLLATLTDWLGVIFDDPVRVAMLQTGGLVLGGWLLVAGFRGQRVTAKYPGNWVYADPLHLYQAYREQVTVTRIDGATDANCDHKHNSNGAYQNSIITLSLGSDRITLTVNDLVRAERLTLFLNYLAWARGPEGGSRGTLPPATLGGLARYVAHNDNEPLDAEGNIDLARIDLSLDHIPEEPAREGRSLPSILPYVFILLGGVGCFFVMKEINTGRRDDTIYEEVMKEPAVEPSRLRAYLMDERNTRHRDQVTQRLSKCYDQPVAHIKAKAQDPQLRDGVLTIFEWLRTAPQPVVSLRVVETESPPGRDADKGARATAVAKSFAGNVNDTFAAQPWGGPVPPPPGREWSVKPPPFGHQIIVFVEPPEGAPGTHIEIEYAVRRADWGSYDAFVTVRIRSKVDEPPVATSSFRVPNVGTEANFNVTKGIGNEPDNFPARDWIRDALVSRLIGK